MKKWTAIGFSLFLLIDGILETDRVIKKTNLMGVLICSLVALVLIELENIKNNNK